MYLFSIELIQMNDSGLEYVSDPWNLNDIVMQVAFWIYCYLRLSNGHLSGNFLIVNQFEFTDRHKEVETMLSMLQHTTNTTEMASAQKLQDDTNYLKDYTSNYIYDQFFMSLFNTLVIVQAAMKLFFFFKVFDTFGMLLKLVI